MLLEELNEKINRRDYQPKDLSEPEAENSDTPAPSLSDSAADKKHQAEWTDSSYIEPHETSAFEKSVLLLRSSRVKKLIILGIGALIFLLGILVALSFRNGAFVNDKVVVSVVGETKVESNVLVTYKITYENRNVLNLEDVELIVNYPSAFRPESGTSWKTNETRGTISLGTIRSGSVGNLELRGSFFAFQDQVGAIQAILRYTPKGTTGRYDVSGQLGVSISSSPLALEITAPQEVGNDQQVEYTVSYRNASDQALENMRLVLDYPKGFQYTSSEPRPSEGEGVWNLGTIPVGGKGAFKIVGRLAGIKDEVKVIKVRLGKPQGDGSLLSFSEAEEVTRIITSPLSIMQIVNGLANATVSPGENLRYNINFKNDSEVSLRSVIITVDLASSLLAIDTLRAEKATYDSKSRQLFFKGSDVPELRELQPGAEGSVAFEINVRSDLAQMNFRDPILETVARIDSPDVPTPIGANKTIASNTIRLKAKADPKVLWSIEPFAADSGLLPTETRYRIRTRVSSNLSDITEASLLVILPGAMRYEKTSTSQEVSTYNERTGELVWQIGTLRSGVTESREFVFDVIYTRQYTSESPSLNGSVLTGKNNFLGQDIRIAEKKVFFQL